MGDLSTVVNYVVWLVLLLLFVSLRPDVPLFLVALRLVTVVPQAGGLLSLKCKGQPVSKTVTPWLVQWVRYSPLFSLFVKAARVLGTLHYVVAGWRMRVAVL